MYIYIYTCIMCSVLGTKYCALSTWYQRLGPKYCATSVHKPNPGQYKMRPSGYHGLRADKYYPAGAPNARPSWHHTSDKVDRYTHP